MQRKPVTASDNRRRRGFTLLETLLVVTILMVMFGVSWPLMQRAYNDLKVREASEHVRLRLGGTRIYAIDSGITYQFRYEPRGRRFLIVPAEVPLQSRAAGSNSEEASQASAGLAREAGELSEGLTFESGEDDSTAEKIDESFLTGLPNAGKLADTGWSAPLYFYSDGSATEAKFRVIDDARQYSEISLRELTGFVSVGQVHRETKR